ncbi:unnamed protein product [Boreogadus saida]
MAALEPYGDFIRELFDNGKTHDEIIEVNGHFHVQQRLTFQSLSFSVGKGLKNQLEFNQHEPGVTCLPSQLRRPRSSGSSMERFWPWSSRGDLPDAADSLSEASGHSSREHQPNDLLNETKQEGVREHPDLEQEHIENLNDLVPDVVVEMFPGDVTQPDICNYDFNEVPSLGSIEVHHAGTNIITLGWAPTEQQLESHYHVLYSCKKIKPQTIQITDSCKVDIEDLLPGTEYTFTIIRIVDGKHSKSESVSVCTEAVPPGNVQVSHVSSSTVSLTWEPPAGLKYDFQIKTQLKSRGLSQPALISAHTDAVPPGNVQVSHITSSTVSLTLEPPAGLKYDFQIKTQLKSGGLSQPAFISAHTDAVPPGNVQVSHITSSTVTLTWEPPAGLKYDFQIKTQLKSGGLSQPAFISAHTEAVPPGNVQVSHVSSSTVSLTWESPAGEVRGYVVTCFCDSETHGEQTTDLDTVTFSDLKPGLKYDFQIKTHLKSGGLSQPALTSAHTEAVPPGNVQVSRCQLVVRCPLHGNHLLPGLKYDFQIKTQLKSGGLSQPALISAHTEAIPPGNVQVSHVSSSTVSLTWDPPAGEVGGYVVTCFCGSETHGEQTTESDTVTFSDLKPGLIYDFKIKTQLKSGVLSQPALISAHTETELKGFLKKLGLTENYKEKLSLSSVLQIDKKTVTEEAAKCLSDLPWCFLKKLMMVKVRYRSQRF